MGKACKSGKAPVKPQPVDTIAISKRLQRDFPAIWAKEISTMRDAMVAEAKAAGMDRLDAKHWAYAELDRMYPTPKPAEKHAESTTIAPTVESGDEVGPGGNARVLSSPAASSFADAGKPALPPAREGQLRGLDAIPPSWPALPPSAQLAAELGWCQANRLLVVAETPRGTTVDLSRAVEPAPSRSALAWLETAIRSYAKFTDVLAKVAAGGSDESEDVRREKVAQHEIERLLASMGG